MNPRKRLAEVIARMAAIQTDVTEIDSMEAPSDEDAARAETLGGEFKELDAERATLQAKVDEIDAIRSAALNPVNVEPGFSAGPEVIVRKDPFENLDAVRQGFVDESVMRSAALSFIEADKGRGVSAEAREQAATLVDGGSGAMARHALLTGSPVYRSAFEKVLRDPLNYRLDADEDEAMRAALSTTGANGGYAIPFLLDPSVILTNDGSANPFRQISRIVRGTSNKWNGLTSAGVTAEWLSEGSQSADATPTFGQPSITAYKGAAYAFGSYEVFDDTNLASELPALIGDAKDRLEADAFAVGSGSGAPFGVVVSTTAVTASRVSPTTAGVFTSASTADVYKTLAALPPRHRSKASHVANYAVFNIIRQMSASSTGSNFWANLGANVPEEMLGRPVYEASAMASSMTTGSNIMVTGDFSQYVIYDRVGVTLEYIPNVVGSNQRPTGQRGWFATWRTGADVVSPNAFRVLKL